MPVACSPCQTRSLEDVDVLFTYKVKVLEEAPLYMLVVPHYHVYLWESTGYQVHTDEVAAH